MRRYKSWASSVNLTRVMDHCFRTLFMVTIERGESSGAQMRTWHLSIHVPSSSRPATHTWNYFGMCVPYLSGPFPPSSVSLLSYASASSPFFMCRASAYEQWVVVPFTYLLWTIGIYIYIYRAVARHVTYPEFLVMPSVNYVLLFLNYSIVFFGHKQPSHEQLRPPSLFNVECKKLEISTSGKVCSPQHCAVAVPPLAAGTVHSNVDSWSSSNSFSCGSNLIFPKKEIWLP